MIWFLFLNFFSGFEPVYFDSQDSDFGSKLKAIRNPSKESDEELVQSTPIPPNETIKALVNSIQKHLVSISIPRFLNQFEMS